MELMDPFTDEPVAVEAVLCPLCQQPMGYEPVDRSDTRIFFYPPTKAGNLFKDDDGTWRHEVCPVVVLGGD